MAEAISLGGKSEEVAKELSEELSEELSKKLSEEISEKLSEELSEEKPEEVGLKCRQCRSGFLVESKGTTEATTDLYLIKDDALPEWISDRIEEASWTKGRLNCPKCQCRVGGFDFVGGSGHPVHLIKSKVDLSKKSGTTVILTADSSIVMLESHMSDSESCASSTSSSMMISSSSEESSANLSPGSISSCSSTSSNCSFSSTTSVSGSLASGCTETSGNDSAEDEGSPRAEAACIITDTFLADDSSDDDSESVKISVKRQHRILRRKRRKLDRAKEKAWQAQEKRRHKKKEKLIKKILDAEPELDNLDSSLMCPVCLDLLFSPFSVVPCKHTFCETCLRRIGSKDPMNTFCPMCRQRVVYCESQSELSISIRESYPDLYKKRATTEKSTNVYEMPLPWRPGWRNLVSGRGLGGNPIGASTVFDYLKTIVQLLPYYVPPVVIANLINMVFFFVLLAAVEVIPFLSGLLQRSAKDALNTKAVMELSEPALFQDASTTNMGVTPNTFLNILMQQNTKEKNYLLMTDKMLLPPTYAPPESTQAMDATFYYIVGGMTLLAAAFGNIIILNFDD